MAARPHRFKIVNTSLSEDEAVMAQFSVNPTRLDPYKNFKFRIKWDAT